MGINVISLTLTDAWLLVQDEQLGFHKVGFSHTIVLEMDELQQQKSTSGSTPIRQ